MDTERSIPSQILPHCWICGRRFTDSGGTALREDHHLIPRAYGGVDGPVVSICDSHHTKVHKIAVRILAGKSHVDLLEKATYDQKILWLASLVVKASRAAKQDPNKRVEASVSLNGEQQVKLDALCRKLGLSRTKTLAYLIEEGYARHFPLKP